jgi:MFS family permease
VDTVTETSHPLPSHPGRRFAVPLAGSATLIGGALGALTLFVQLYMKSLGASPVLIGLITSLNAAGVLLGSLLWGAVADRLRRKLLLCVAAACFSAGLLFMALRPGIEAVLVTAFLRLFMYAGFGAVMIAVVSSTSTDAHRAKNVSYVSSARALGVGLGSLSAGFALDSLGFPVSFLLTGLLPALALVFVAGLPAEPSFERTRQRGALHMARAAGLLSLYAATALRQMAILGAFSLLFVYMDTLDIPVWLMGIVGSLNMFTQTVALVAFGRLADRIGRRRVFLLGFALSILTPCMFVILTNAAGMAIGYITLGLSFSSLYIGSAAHIGDRVPLERHGTMLGLYESSRGFGGLFGPLIAGVLVPLVGYAGMFLAMAGIASIGLGILLLGDSRPSRRRGAAIPGRS